MIDELTVQALRNRVRKLEELTIQQGFMLDKLEAIANQQQEVNLKLVEAMRILNKQQGAKP